MTPDLDEPSRRVLVVFDELHKENPDGAYECFHRRVLETLSGKTVEELALDKKLAAAVVDDARSECEHLHRRGFLDRRGRGLDAWYRISGMGAAMAEALATVGATSG